MLVGTIQLYTHKWVKKYQLETLFEDDIVKAREKRQIFKIVRVFLVADSNVFNNSFVFLYSGEQTLATISFWLPHIIKNVLYVS